MVAATEFTPLAAIIGGALLGTAAVIMMWSVGRIAGISGIVAGAVMERADERHWRLAFIAGMFIGAFIAASLTGALDNIAPVTSMPMMLIAGIVVGFGTRLGSGCTSGHGVCGISRLSQRSIVATGVFMASGMITVFVIRHLLGEGV